MFFKHILTDPTCHPSFNGHLLVKVALSGAHTVGACHVNRSGFERPDEKLKFDAWRELEKSMGNSRDPQ